MNLEMIKYRVHHRAYSRWRAIIQEWGSDTEFLIGLRHLFGIEIDKKADPELFVIEDTLQINELAKTGVVKPTLLQIVLTSSGFGLTEDEAVRNWNNRMAKL